MSNHFDNYDQAYLDAMDNEYASTEIKRTEYCNLPDGQYQAYIDSMCVRESKKNPGEIGLSINLIVLNGGYDGVRLNKYIPIDIDHIKQLKRDLTAIEFPYDGIASLDDEERLKTVLDAIMDITITHREYNGRNYMNVWLNRRVGQYNQGDGIPAPEAPSATPWGQRY